MEAHLIESCLVDSVIAEMGLKVTKQTRTKAARKNFGAPPINKIASFRIDHGANTAFFTTKNMLLNQFKRDAPKITSSFDRLAKADIQACSDVFGEAMGLIIRHLPRLDDDSYKPTVSRLLSTAVNTYLASIEVARHGYRRQYGVLGRTFIETIATVVIIATQTERLDQFHDNKLNSKKCVGWASKIMPMLGHYYGLLSEYNVHVGPIHAIFEPVSRYKENDEALGVIKLSMRADALLLYLVAELAYQDEVANPKYWKSTDGGITFAPSDAQRAWMEAYMGTDGSL